MLLTTTSKVNAVKKLIREKKYDEAVDIAERIDPDKVNSVYDLSSIAEAYMKKGRLEEAKHLYLVMYERSKSHKVMTGLIELSLKLKEPKDAERFLREFRRMEPDNPERLVYRYRVDSMLGKEPEYLVKSLAKLKNEEYTDVWALELAKAYYKCNDREACAAECHSIIKYFPDSEAAKKARVLLGACEMEEEEEEVVTAPETEMDTTEIAESLLEDVSAMLEENAAAEAVANEVIDEKVIASQTAAHPVPYLRTIEFLTQCKPSSEDKSLYGDPAEDGSNDSDAASAKDADAAAAAGDMKALSEAFVLPESLKGQIDNIIFETDEDEDDIVVSCAVAEDAADNTNADNAADDDDDDDDEIVIRDYFTEDGSVTDATAEDENSFEGDESDDETEDDDLEDTEDGEESDEDSDEDDAEDDGDSFEDNDSDDESEDDDADESDASDDAFEDDDEDDVEEDAESDEDSDEDDAEDDGDSFEDDESDDESEDDEDDENESDASDDAFEDDDEDDVEEDAESDEDSDEDDAEDDSDDASDEGDEDDADTFEEDAPAVEDEDPRVNEELDSVADKIASQILSARAEDQRRREEDPDGVDAEPDDKPEDTKVMEGLSDRAFREAVRDDDEAIERALYSLLGDSRDDRD